MHKGKVVVVVRALYGLRGSGYAWASEIRKLIRDLGFTPYRVDRYIWMRRYFDTSNLRKTTDAG